MAHLFHTGATAVCQHQAAALLVAPNQARVQVNGQFVATAASKLTFTPLVCPFMVGQKKQPCATAQWSNVSTRLLVDNKGVLLQAPSPTGTAPAVCQSAEGFPQGAPSVNQMQQRVTGG